MPTDDPDPRPPTRSARPHDLTDHAALAAVSVQVEDLTAGMGPTASANRADMGGDASERTRFVLVGTSHAGNVGAAARAIKVMGFGRLVLVAPRFPDVLVQEETVAMASGAADVLTRARIVATLDEALAGVHLACATAMTPRDFGPPTAAPRAVMPALQRRVAVGEHIAFVFGSERYGLSNEDVWRCQHCLSIPTAPGYGSLNLAQAVQVLAYEWRQALGGYAVVERTRATTRASHDALAGLLTHWREVLVQIGYLDPAKPRKLMPRLQQLLLRARPSDEEVHILRGIARAAAHMRPQRGGDKD